MPKLINPKIEFTDASKLSFEQAILLVGTTMNRSLPSMLKLSAVAFARSAAIRTPQAKKNRKFKAISEKKERILWEYGIRFRIQKFDKTLKKFKWVYAKNDNEKIKKALIKNRGFYKFVWKMMLPKLGASTGKGLMNSKSTSYAQRSQRVTNRSHQKNEPYILLTNRRGEMRKIAPGIVPHAMNKAKSGMVKYMNKTMKRRLERAMGK